MDRLRGELRIARWSGSGGLYGTRGQVREARKLLRAALADIVDRLQFVDERKLGFLRRLETPYRALTKRTDLHRALMILPALSFGAYNILAFVPLLNAALAAKVLENSTDYSLNNTVRNMLFLPCTYQQKFAAKQAIDSFFVRMGDVLSAALVFVGTSVVVLSSRGFALVNVVLALVALLLAWRVGRYYKTLTASSEAPSAAA